MVKAPLGMLDLFSGIGGFSLAAHWLGGFETVQFVEKEPFCQRILSKHWPSVPIHDDICTFNPEPGSADVVVGGFPCQDISTAGKQAGIKEGTRSGLFYELMRIVRLVGPRYVVLENVAAITSNGLDTVLGTLAEAGFDAEWACIPAADVGACHRRDRWWAVAYANQIGRDGDPHARADRQTNGASGQNRIINALAAEHCSADAAYSPHLLGHGGALGHYRESRVRAIPQPRDGDSAGDVANTQGRRDSGSDQHTGQPLQPERMGESGMLNAPNPHHERQQECQPAAITSGPGWTGWGDAPRRLNPDWRSYLSEPVLCRGDDGLSNRVDRLKALGNAVVPQVAMVPLGRVLERENYGKEEFLKHGQG